MKRIAAAAFMFVFVVILGIICLIAGGTHWGTSGCGLGLFITFSMALLFSTFPMLWEEM